MKALSIRQPWAWAILSAGKRIENRSWITTIRGPILIHAGQGMTRAEYEDFCLYYADLRRHDDTLPDVPKSGDLLRGGVVGKANLVNCVRRHSSPWFQGPFGFVLEDVEPAPFAPWSGSLGFFEIDGGILQQMQNAYRDDAVRASGDLFAHR